MELWLVVGALVLIALTVWIVWPAQQRAEEQPQMSTNFEDQYTSATADLSAGGVATAMQSGEPVDPGLTGATMPTPTMPSPQPALPAPERGMRLTEPRTVGTGMALVLMVGGGVGGAWLYARWQRERNRPINRFRRGASQLADRLSHRLPEMDIDDLPQGSAPAGGVAAAAALVVSSLLVARARRRSDPIAESRDVIWDRLEEGRQRARQFQMPEMRGRVKDMRGRANEMRGRMPDVRGRMPEMRGRMPEMRTPPAKQTMLGGLGLGGTAMVVGAAWLIWRLLRGGSSSPQHLYITDRMGE